MGVVVDVQSLCEWNASDDSALLNAVNELLVIYKQYQSSLLKGSRLEYDYSLLLEECSLDNVEVYVSGSKNTVSSLSSVFPGYSSVECDLLHHHHWEV